MTIEDKILRNILDIVPDDYSKGRNKSMRVVCSLCGEVSDRGEYYKRDMEEPDSTAPYMFICKDCYEWLCKEGLDE